MTPRHGRTRLGPFDAWRDVLSRRPYAVVIGAVVAVLIVAAAVGLGGLFPWTKERAGTVMGLAAPNAPGDHSALVGFETYGRPADYLLWYHDFAGRIDVDEVQALPAELTPIITWEPFDAVRGGVDQSRYRLSAIADGDFDGYLRQWGADVKQISRVVILRFAHEMNGDWYPWSEQVNGNGPGDYVRAWNHVHDVLRDAGVTNVQWMWSPNVEYPGSAPLEELYPGDDRVDLIGIDGYNWGDSDDGRAWQWPKDLFSPTVDRVRELSPRPILISEVGSAEAGGSKAEWIERFAEYLEDNPDIEGFVWFDYDKETDWRINSSVESSGAFVDLVARLPGRDGRQP